MAEEGSEEALHRLTAAQAARLIRTGELGSEQLVTALLEHLAAREPEVGAWETLDPEWALEQARARDREPPSGPLHGVPVGVKDLIDTADLPTSYGSPIYAGHRPAADAACVARLREAGAVVLGKTVTTEFALFRPGKTRNPHDPARTPGGSSSGSAAAVGAGMVPVALGTQTAGSVIRPASFCGTFGLKPTFGSFDLRGVKPVSPSLDTLGHFARAVEDLGLVARILAGPPAGAVRFEVADLDRPRLGFFRTPHWEEAAPDTRERIEQAVVRLERECRLEEVEAEPGFAELVSAQVTIMEREAAGALAWERSRHPGLLSESLTELLGRGSRISDEEYRRALDRRDRWRERLEDLFGDDELLLTPSVLGEAPVGLDSTGDPLFCRSWTLLGTPAVSVPGLTGGEGMPLGVQLVGRPGQDGVVLAAARWLAERLA